MSILMLIGRVTVPGVFISYAREDLEFVTRLYDGLAAAARNPAWDQDHSVVPFGAMYEAEISAAIAASDKLVFVLTPASLASEPCRWEISRAQESGKQIIPLLRVPLAEDVPVPDAVGKRNWIVLTGDSQAEFDKAFGQLIQALDTDLDWVHGHTWLQMRAEEWAGSESGGSKLLRGADLRSAESWLAGETEHPATPPTIVQRQYLTASRRAATRLARIVRGALAGGMAVALGLAVYAFIQRAQAVAEKNQAVFNQTTAEAAQLATTSTSLAANLNAAAYDMKAAASIRSRLIQTENTPLATPLRAGRVPVQAVAFSPGGQVLATGDHSGVVRLWQVSNPDHPRLLAIEKTAQKVSAGETVTSLAFSPHDQLLAAGAGGGGSRGLVMLWSVTNPSRPRLVRQLPNAGKYTVLSVAFSPDGTYLATGDGNGTGIVYDLAHLPDVRSLAPLRVSRAGYVVSRVAFSPDGKLLAMGDAGGVLRMWNFANPLSPRPLGELQASGGMIDSIAFNSGGTVLAAGQLGGIFKLWNVSTPAHASLLSQPQGTGSAGGASLAFAGSGWLMASGSEDGSIQFWNTAYPSAPEPVGQPVAFGTSVVNSLTFSPAGGLLASADNSGNVALWHLPATVLTNSAQVGSVAYSPDGNLLASGSYDGTVSLWNVAQPDPSLLVQQRVPGDKAYFLAFSPDGRFLATGGHQGAVQLYNVSGAAGLKPAGTPFRADRAAVYSAAFSKKANMLATGDHDGTVTLWSLRDPAKPAIIAVPQPPNDLPIYSLAFSPSGTLLATGEAGGLVTLYDVNDPPHPHKLARITFPDGAPVTSVAFGRHGTMLAAGSYDGTVTLWALISPSHPQRISEFMAPGGTTVQSVAISPDGQRLAVGGNNGTIPMWDIANPAHPQPAGQPLTLAPGDSVLAVAFGRTSQVLATGSYDALRTWNLSVTRAHAWICDATPGTLTPQVWAHYIPQQAYQPPCRSAPS